MLRDTVLLTEPDATLLRMFELFFQVNFPRLRVLSAADENRAVRIALREYPGLALLRVDAPGLNALQLCRRLRAFREPDEMRILCYGYGVYRQHETIRKEGADAVLQTPLSMQTLREKILALPAIHIDPPIPTPAG